MDRYLFSGLFVLVIALWTIVAVKREGVCRLTTNGSAKDEIETVNQNGDDEH
jgi:hypothetical protein